MTASPATRTAADLKEHAMSAGKATKAKSSKKPGPAATELVPPAEPLSAEPNERTPGKAVAGTVEAPVVPDAVKRSEQGGAESRPEGCETRDLAEDDKPQRS
jgi:hypothetical protein